MLHASIEKEQQIIPYGIRIYLHDCCWCFFENACKRTPFLPPPVTFMNEKNVRVDKKQMKKRKQETNIIATLNLRARTPSEIISYYLHWLQNSCSYGLSCFFSSLFLCNIYITCIDVEMGLSKVREMVRIYVRIRTTYIVIPNI